jgi:CMP/dCMP kinase
VIVAIDGPAASGKGTLARRLAAHYGLRHLDTGALYRAAGWRVLGVGGDPSDPGDAVRAAAAVRPEDTLHPALRSDAVAQAASIVAAIPAVRAQLLAFQRDFAAAPPGAVLDGRDIGTVVCPAADAKLFVTASVAARARRRFDELRGKGEDVIYGDVLQDMERRDARDSGRAVAPLKPADDAFFLDTSGLDADQAFAAALDFISQRTGKR